MKKYILKFGLYGAAVLVLTSLIVWSAWGTSLGYSTSEAIGYASMVLSMVFVFMGIKTYRDQEKGGVISFGESFKLGILISLLPSLAFGVYTVLFFYAYGDKFLEFAMTNMTAEQRAQLEAAGGLFLNPFFQGTVMFFTVFMIGLLASLISAAVLKRAEA